MASRVKPVNFMRTNRELSLIVMLDSFRARSVAKKKLGAGSSDHGH